MHGVLEGKKKTGYFSLHVRREEKRRGCGIVDEEAVMYVKKRGMEE